ncbi:alcohol dehydrogenase superfamily protein [Roridomyces roridus]|uniref:Alcohol dehydrogenase superfamily protein n=1 Tax=Roridomyces roridus TaxID=1738132 RepID=A0AAD7FKY8_9AGAR|nr:alcohol dehydrogenase superfamily protein [Roridomyces roridus]
MPLPQSTRHFYYSKDGPGTYHNLAIKTSPLAPPGAGQVLVKVHAVSLQAHDLNIAKDDELGTDKNLIPCSDMAGKVFALGEAVSEWKVGDRVMANLVLDYLDGDLKASYLGNALSISVDEVLSEYRVFPAHALISIPEHLSYEEASTLPCAALTAFNALHGSEPMKAGDTVFIPGTGGVAISALQFAIAAGAQVIISSSSDRKLAFAKVRGATHLVNYKTTPEWDQEVLKFTNGVGADHVLEMNGGPDSFERSLKAVRMAGNVAIIGGSAGGNNPTPARPICSTTFPNTLNPILAKVLKVRGILGAPVSLFKEMTAFMSAHPETTRPVIDKVFEFEQAREAYAYLDAQQHVGKVAIRVAQSCGPRYSNIFMT